MADTLLRTAAVGRPSVPERRHRLRALHVEHRLAGVSLDRDHHVVIHAAVKDQERVGLDVVTDGELRRDCGLRHPPADVAVLTLQAPDAGTASVRREPTGAR